jgi:hypothetical protein
MKQFELVELYKKWEENQDQFGFVIIPIINLPIRLSPLEGTIRDNAL